ncbi:MAG: apolipoprotein N-acyltransferase, partial [Desulfocapsaceae bacterium]|nr:apolipoprotein N-acyltransferase [Desulfocapsaceae bacterium]
FSRFKDPMPVPLSLVGVPAAWVGLDWLRSWFLGGFPWMDFGYGLWSVPEALQTADLFGHHVLTFMIVLVNLVIYISVGRRFSGLQKIISAGVLVILLSGGLLYSRSRWTEVAQRVDNAAAAQIGIVQGNIEQVKKWSPEERLKTVESYLELSGSLVAGEKKPDLLVWPETALPFYPRGNELLRPISSFLRQSAVTLLTGAPWYEVVDWEKRLFSYYNGAFMFSGLGVPGDSYFKSHLVPYGEYVPLKKYMPFLAPLVEAAGDFTPGIVGTPLAAGPARAGVLICYESIFADIGRRWVENGANLLVNLTNDAWYGKSSAPYQSWAMTVLRAVETRRSLVRSANTGISGIIDPLGRVQSRSELFVTWAETVSVPLMAGKTHYVSRGFLFAPVCAAVGFLLCIGAHVMDQRRKKWYRDAWFR